MAEWWEEEGAVDDGMRRRADFSDEEWTELVRTRGELGMETTEDMAFPIDQTVPVKGAAPQSQPEDWYLQAGAIEQQPFRVDPELTPESIEEMDELTDISAMLEGRQPAVSAEMEALGLAGLERGATRMGENLSQAWLNMTTTDPMELGQILESRFPEDLEVTVSQDGVPVVTNRHTGKQVVINRPGFSPMDILQTIGLIGAYAPMGRAMMGVTGTGKRALAGAAGSGATETVLQAGQELAGGTADPEDIALSTMLGVVPEVVAQPLLQAGSKLKGIATGEYIPQGIRKAIEYASDKTRNYTIATTDALQEYLTPTTTFFVRATERIPYFGTGAMRRDQLIDRAQSLSDLAHKFDINVENPLDAEIFTGWFDRMIKQRFWGKNKNPTRQQIEAAWKREADDVSGTILERYIKKGDIDENLVDKVLKTGKPQNVTDLMAKLTPEGQAAVRQRFIVKGLDRAGWHPDLPSQADPGVLAKYLSDNKNRRIMKELFDPEDLEMMEGMTAYLQLTNAADQASAGAGMTAAMAAAGGLYFLELAMAGLAGAGTGYLAQAGQSAPIRNLLLRLKTAKGNPELVHRIMADLTPAFVALGEQQLQEKVDQPEQEMSIADMVKGGETPGMGALRTAAEAGMGVMESISRMMTEREPDAS